MPSSDSADTIAGASVQLSRRGLLARMGALTGVLLGYSGLRKSSRAPAAARGPLGILRPPGSQSESEFLALCIRCTRCADACEAQCIQFFGPEAGRLRECGLLMLELSGLWSEATMGR